MRGPSRTRTTGLLRKEMKCAAQPAGIALALALVAAVAPVLAGEVDVVLDDAPLVWAGAGAPLGEREALVEVRILSLAALPACRSHGRSPRTPHARKAKVEWRRKSPLGSSATTRLCLTSRLQRAQRPDSTSLRR